MILDDYAYQFITKKVKKKYYYASYVDRFGFLQNLEFGDLEDEFLGEERGLKELRKYFDYEFVFDEGISNNIELLRVEVLYDLVQDFNLWRRDLEVKRYRKHELPGLLHRDESQRMVTMDIFENIAYIAKKSGCGIIQMGSVVECTLNPFDIPPKKIKRFRRIAFFDQI